MKKLFIFLMFVLIGCGGSSNNSTPPATVKKIIKGQAAIGSFLPVGAEVDIRPAPVNGVPCDLIVTSIADDSGSYSADITTITQAAGTTPINANQPSGYIVRVYTGSGWLYSYADNQGDAMTADVNPYTDIMIRVWYQYINISSAPGGGNNYDIDVLFPTGLFSDNATPMDVPDSTVISEAIATMNNMLIRVYNLSNMDNFLNMQWEEGAPIDCLLGSTDYTELEWFLNTEFIQLFYFPDVLTDGAAFQGATQPFPGGNGAPLTVDIWTPYGNTGNVTLSYINNSFSYNGSMLMVKQSDSVAGSNHFQAITPPVQEDNEMSVMITIDDYNNGTPFQMVVHGQ